MTARNGRLDIGFADEPNWPWLIAESLIRNFFAAILRETIRFTISSPNGNDIEINAASIAALFDCNNIRSAAESTGTTDILDFSKAMLDALNSSEAERITETFQNIGTFRLTLLQREGLPRHLGILRNGMYIVDNLRHFNHPMKRFPMSKDFVAVLEPVDEDANVCIREMESPRHDEVSAERIDDPKMRGERKAGMKELGAWVRSTIKSRTAKPAEVEVLLDEMNRFFGKPGDGKTMPDPGRQDNSPERPKITLRPQPTVPRVGSGPEGDSGSSGGIKGGTKEKRGRTSGVRRGQGRGKVGGRGGRHVAYASLRNFGLGERGILRAVSFTPAQTATAVLEIAAMGVSSDEGLAIRAINGEICLQSPKVELKQGERVSLEVELHTPYTGPISVVLSPIEEADDAD